KTNIEITKAGMPPQKTLDIVPSKARWDKYALREQPFQAGEAIQGSNVACSVLIVTNEQHICRRRGKTGRFNRQVFYDVAVSFVLRCTPQLGKPDLYGWESIDFHAGRQWKRPQLQVSIEQNKFIGSECPARVGESNTQCGLTRPRRSGQKKC